MGILEVNRGGRSKLLCDVLSRMRYVKARTARRSILGFVHNPGEICVRFAGRSLDEAKRCKDEIISNLKLLRPDLPGEAFEGIVDLTNDSDLGRPPVQP